MWRIYQTIPVSLFAATTILLSGCGVTLSPVKRTPVQIVPLETSITTDPQRILVQFESAFSDVPLADTVWDNKIGPFDDPQESDWIGFIQDETSLASAEFIGGPAAGFAVGTSPSYTRILIPFGRIFEGVFQTGLAKVFPNSAVSFDDSSLPNKLQNAMGYVVKLKVVEFNVWEQPLNHLNFTARIECELYQTNNITKPVHTFEAHNELLKQPIGSVLSTDTSMTRNMNQMANLFAATLSQGILKDLRDNIGK